MQQILPQIAREQQAGRDCVLVTLISSNGSAPRKYLFGTFPHFLL